jgi:hypothetical protein
MEFAGPSRMAPAQTCAARSQREGRHPHHSGSYKGALRVLVRNSHLAQVETRPRLRPDHNFGLVRGERTSKCRIGIVEVSLFQEEESKVERGSRFRAPVFRAKDKRGYSEGVADTVTRLHQRE